MLRNVRISLRHLCLATALCLTAVSAQAADRIVAVVNDQVITQSQLDSRTNLSVRQLGLSSPNSTQRSAIARRTLSTLIDEELQRQYAATARLKTTPADIEAAKAEAVQSVGGESLWAPLVRGVEASANEQLAAEALWKRIIARDIQPRVQVSTAEADRMIAEMSKSRQVIDREISVIQIEAGADSAADKTQLDKITELRKKISEGEPFTDIARAHSEDKSAVNGGNLGWFSNGQLNPQLEEALDKMQTGQVSQPIRTPVGWYLVKLENVRSNKPFETDPQTQVDLFLLAATTPSDTKAVKNLNKSFDKTTESLTKADAVRAYFDSNGFEKAFPESRALGWVVVTDLDADLKKAVEKTKPGRWSESVNVNGTSSRVFVADTRQAMPAKLEEYRNRVLNNMYGSRVELEARRFMQNLRQRAFLDVRL